MVHLGAPVPISPLQSDREVSAEDQRAGGSEDNNDITLGSRFSSPGNSTGNEDQSASETGPLQVPDHRPSDGTAPEGVEEEAADRMSAYWQANNLQKPLSGDAKHLIEMSWRPGTESSYKSNWKRWCRYAREHGVQEITPSLDQVIEYLTFLFNEGLQYSTINSHRSTLSGTIMPIEGFKVGEHPLVLHLLKGIFNVRPLKKNLILSWEVDIVLEHLKTWSHPSELSLSELTR